MRLQGKILGALAGSLVGGLLFGDITGLVVVGLLGMFLGHFGFDAPRERTFEKDYQQYIHRKNKFVLHVFALGAKIAKSDGKVSTAEIQVMKNLLKYQFKLPEKQHVALFEVWRKSKDGPISFEMLAKQFFNEFAQDRNRVLEMMHLLFEVAAADGNLHPNKENMLKRAAGIFHIGKLQYERIKSRFFHPPAEAMRWHHSDPYYLILGASPADSLDTIKKKYRELVKKWHPDRVMANGASPEGIKHAKEKFQQITEAYEHILEIKGAAVKKQPKK